jgi:hypothetical protein
VLSGGLGFVAADALDRLLATYNPSSTEERPTDKFTSDGSGTIANTLNIASVPSWARIGAGVGVAAVPTVGAMFVENPLLRASVEGFAIGAAISTLKTFWNTVVMGKWLAPKDTSTPSLQKSYIARLYPSEVAAQINRAQAQTTTSAAFGALSGQQAGVGADVGPFALQGDSPYADTAQALRRQTGVQDPAYPSQQNVWGTGDYGTAAQALRKDAGMKATLGGYEPGPPTDPGPGPKAEPHTDPSCGCGDPTIGFSAFLGDQQAAE